LGEAKKVVGPSVLFACILLGDHKIYESSLSPAAVHLTTTLPPTNLFPLMTIATSSLLAYFLP